ncbi:putative acetyltransferase [Yersinia nurmii]|uniref:tRNA(Met) cytidine acetyltransferase TmcA n=1 Tax=Yersinia nurmii TaxID=685706 RepID=A0ABM9S3K6_9GAMM|nr:GNAT family N-acetyltransferase [Yersinia nurmii]CNE06646.1 putative acetyltransferase [Yersinia nurmii]
MIDTLVALQPQMVQQGIRRLVVLSGSADWSRQQAKELYQRLGSGVWLAEQAPDSAEMIAPLSAKTLLGQERLHGFFDATQGVNIDALAILAGTLQAGSWLVLLVPEWESWPTQPDEDSLRWSELPQPIATPNFIRHLQRHMLADSETIVWRQNQVVQQPQFAKRATWQPATGAPTQEQRAILYALLHSEADIWVVTAPRGRGKSTLAGMLVNQWSGACWVTGPTRSATEILNHCGDRKAQFWAPDALLHHLETELNHDADWLIVDEAAAIPTPQLSAMLAHFPRVLLISTVQGYEGTGRGFLLKFCASLPHWQGFTLKDPIRWTNNDPLENCLDRALLFTDPIVTDSADLVTIRRCQQQDWLNDPDLLTEFYGLLCSAHYRTSPLDLRRLMDAPGMHFSAAVSAGQVIGALWLVDEGGLTAELAWEVWAGRRRPRGSLVAQSLAAHGGLWRAPTLRSRRVSRVAVLAQRRREGIARQIIAEETQRAKDQGVDFLSVSFGFTEDLWQFWQSCGFELVRIGSHKEASSGCYAAMGILPLTSDAVALCLAAKEQLARDWRWLRRWIDLTLPFPDCADTDLNEDDWQELAGFSFGFRPIEASLAALNRLLLHCILPLPALRQYLQEGVSTAEISQNLKLSGRKALITRWREETALGLSELDVALTGWWRERVKGD